MTEPLRVGLLGLTHDHVWDNLPHLLNHPDTVLVAAADPHAELLARVNDLAPCFTSTNYDDVLKMEGLDAVWIFGSNKVGAELATTAAQNNLHVLIEKPMAASYAGATSMFEASRQNRTRLLINWPFAWWPQLQHALQLAHDGAVGDIWQVKYRAAHEGPAELGCSSFFCDWLFDEEQNGGGAMMDYCCYGCVLAAVVQGSPDTVQGMSGRFVKDSISVDDNAIIVMKYANGMATAEASWTQIGKLTAYTTAIYGTTGTLMVEPGAGSRLLLATPDDPNGSPVEVPAAAEHLTNPAAHFVHGIRTGEPFQALCRADSGRAAQEILEAGRKSARSGQQVTLPL
jgi:predicted dehydrogenase